MQALLLRLSYGALDRDAARFAQRFDIAVTEIGRSGGQAARWSGGQAASAEHAWLLHNQEEKRG